MPRFVDLSREIYHRSPEYPGQPKIIHGLWKSHEEAFRDSGNVQGNAVMYCTMSDHTATHLDAPRHFHADGASIDNYPLENCYVMGICLDLQHIPPRGEIGSEELKKAVEKAGAPIPKGGTVLLCTGHHARTYPTPAYGTENAGLNVEGTEWLASQGIVHFGIDAMRAGPDGKVNFLVHKACHDLGITHIESLCNLEVLFGVGQFRFVCFPLKFREGTGSPIRAVAILEE